ncbi:3'(2'),5'-bisphosphate nucleotidase CysQ [Xinfangfangia sp. D13-10-4-6]|uniref:3'(2'),5'-bisphosphate nucleotidase CysQ n=1 Tax=Pseudogemmobacter hezensis TaxID=2737662 RepID=UPI0015558517|nr:3'(2'),5'-bisphosphate nucleotidase CysQ [Pseudogemmobacter hezensis]NPD14225.1 3'(2'),5'-bisphosphate nucleotidase CysQ [Pseudogemmobacter hezensis]
MPGPDRAPVGAAAADAEDLALLERAARAAGPIALLYWRRAPEAWEKPGDAGPVSEADLAVDRALRETLMAARPGYGWLSEETPDDLARLSHEDVFIVDPIDGTRAYLAGEKEFALSLAVVRRGRVVAGVVHLPARDLTYTAALGGPALCNGLPISASSRASLSGASLMTNRANLDPAQWPGGLPDVKRVFRSSLAYRLCLAAEGRADAMLSLRPTWEWDAAAGSLIAAAAGCVISDRHGAALVFNRQDARADGIVAAPPALHAELMARLHP